MTASLNGGSVRVLWDADDTAEVTITGSGSAVWTVNGGVVTFPYTLSSSTTFETTHAGSYDVSVEHHGYEVASTPDGTRSVELRFGEQAIFSPTPDGTPNNKFMSDLHGSLSATIATAQTGLDFAPLIATETAVTTVRPIGSIGDGYVYGTHNTTGGLYRSTDGTSWTQIPNLTGNPITIHDANDGEVLVNRSGTLQKSSGWSTNPLTATFATVATATSGASFIQSDIDVHDNIVLLGEYAVPRTPSRLIRVSTNNGATFTDTLNLDTLHPANIADTHWHAVAIDPWHTGANPRLYVSHGDGPRGVYYSDDLGANWTLLRNDWQPMPMIATENGVVTGTDANDPDGVWLIPRADTSTREQLYRIPAPYWSNSLLGFGLRAFRDDYTGTVYLTFRVDTLASHGKNLQGMIFATDGYRASLVYESELAAATGQNVTWDSPATLPDGSLLVSYLEPGSTAVRRLVRTEPARRGDQSTYRLNDGNALTGTALDRASVVIGPETTGTGRSVLIGTGITQVSTDASTDYRQVLIGDTVSGGNQAVGIGQDVIAAQQRAVAVGMTAKVTGTDGVALGANTISHTSGVAIGKASTNGTGINCVAIGMNSANTGNNSTAVGFAASAAATSVAIGRAAVASHAGSVAIGDSTVTTSSAQFAIGAKHIDSAELGGDPAAPAANGWRLYAKDNGAGKTQLCVRFNTGVVQILATEP